jgi:hypothetical protein
LKIKRRCLNYTGYFMQSKREVRTGKGFSVKHASNGKHGKAAVLQLTKLSVKKKEVKK